ncbi:ciliogenesis and planar polarity effector 1-like isoform X2 [Carassius auratus]|uniref:Ciliogenesis and planar polarity effector 1-like isoform X2 n=1 Tax=Carassius auratus TaxID=7957 RepID=A0A6P6P6P6_CARAU|nr:ciliogenesis and planar polarity effector 1-like isoform X2 [Carassius auratus]
MICLFSVKLEPCERDPDPDLKEETLGVSGLSDVKDILCELIRDGALSRSALDLSRSGTLHRSRSEVEPSGAMMEEERRDLRMWMRRKQRERLIEYRKQREEKREREHRPFISPVKHNLTSVDLATSKRTKAERDRLLLQEHHERRARDACGLISECSPRPSVFPQSHSRASGAPLSPQGKRRGFPGVRADRRDLWGKPSRFRGNLLLQHTAL